MERNERGHRNTLIALAICGAAFLLRLAAAIAAPNHFWAYTAYYDLAREVARGGGYCLQPGLRCAYFPPVYPTVLAAGILTGHPRWVIVLLGCATGAATVWMVYLIGRTLFGVWTGLVAAAYAAVYPYYVWHDAVIQETATLTLVVAITIYFLIRAGRATTPRSSFWPGCMLALSVLTKANLALFVPFALAWIAFASQGSVNIRARRVVWAVAGVALVLGPWVVRTWRITGSPVLYSNGGEALWQSNHALTFDYFPRQSIDAASDAAWNNLSPAEKSEFDAIEDAQGIRQGQWFWNKGMQFIRENPALTLKRAVYKVWIAFSPVFSPAKSMAFQTLYFVFYFPLFVLAGVGAWCARGQWREVGYIYMAIASFALGCAIFWGHTSHRMYIEPYLMMLAVYGSVTRLLKSRVPGVLANEAGHAEDGVQQAEAG